MFFYYPASRNNRGPWSLPCDIYIVSLFVLLILQISVADTPDTNEPGQEIILTYIKTKGISRVLGTAVCKAWLIFQVFTGSLCHRVCHQ